MLKYIYLLTCFLLSSFYCDAQFFQATIEKDGNDLIFFVRANPAGGDITTNWIDTEFFVRWPDSSPAFTFGAITINTTDFPGISIPNNGQNAQGSEVGYTNNWFGTSFTATSSSTYTEGVEYEIFRVTLDIPAANVDFELVHNDGFVPHYLALIGGTGSDLSNVGGNMFYGDNAMICSPNCPASTPGSNHVDEGNNAPLPVELFSFTASKLDEEVDLEWMTASEDKNRGFYIERKNAISDWTQIGFVEGRGTTSDFSTYDFMDRSPSTGFNYYRLKQMDFDSSFEYSKIRVVEFESRGNTVSVFPNPTSDVVNIQLDENINEGSLQLFDQLGRLVMQERFGESEYLKTISLNQFPEGVYTINIISEDQRFSEKIILQKPD